MGGVKFAGGQGKEQSENIRGNGALVLPCITLPIDIHNARAMDENMPTYAP